MCDFCFFFSRTRRTAAYHYIKKKKWDKNPYKTHPLTPLCSKQTGAPLTHKVGDLDPKLTLIQPLGKEVIDTLCPCQAPIEKLLLATNRALARFGDSAMLHCFWTLVLQGAAFSKCCFSKYCCI